MKEKESSWIKKVTGILPFLNRRDAVTFFVFICISTIFWGVQTAHQQHDSTFDVELIIENQPASAVFTTQLPKELKVTLYDNNLQLFDYQYHKVNRTLKVDFERYADVMGNFRISGAELQSLLLNELNSSTKITAISPAFVDARFAVTQGKKVAVKPQAICTCAPNYIAFQPYVSPDSVIVHAPNYILDTLTCIETEPCAYYGLKDTLETKLQLKLNLGVKASLDSVTYLVPIVQQVNKTINDIEIRVTDVPADKQLIVFPRKTRLQLLVNYEYFNSITEQDFKAYVSYNDISNNRDSHLPIHLESRLGGSVLFRMETDPKSVEYIVVE